MKRSQFDRLNFGDAGFHRERLAGLLRSRLMSGSGRLSDAGVHGRRATRESGLRGRGDDRTVAQDAKAIGRVLDDVVAVDPDRTALIIGG